MVFGGNRAVKVTLDLAVQGYLANQARATKATQDFGKAAVRAARDHQQEWSQVTTVIGGAGLAIATGVGAAVKSFADFDKAMSRVAAGTNATGTALSDLRQAALDAGAQTQYSATEAADAITQLGKAGVATKDILSGGLAGTLALAAAGELQVADAAELAATAMIQFGLRGQDLGHVADVLAAGAGKAQGSVGDLGYALSQVGPVAKGMNISLDETVGVLAQFASQGLVGEKGGTALRGMLVSLTGPSEKASQTLKELGINVYDAAGQFIGLDGVAGELREGLRKLSPAQRDAALSTIFNSEQLAAAQILYRGGAAAVQEWTGKVNDQGFAAKQAAMLTDNLAGDLERLKGSLETTLIQAGSGANDGLRGLTQTAEDAVNAFGALPGPVQQGVTAIAGFGAAGLLAVAGIGKATGAVIEFRDNLNTLGTTAGGTRNKLGAVTSFLGGPWGLALAAAAGGLLYFAKQAGDSKGRVDSLTEALKANAGAVGDNARELLANELQQRGAFEQAKLLGISLADVTAAATGQGDALARVNDRIAAFQESGRAGAAVTSKYTEAADGLQSSLRDTTGELGQAMAAAKNQTEALRPAADATGEFTRGVEAQATAFEQAKQSLDDYRSALSAYLASTLSVEAANDAFQAGLNGLKDAAKGADVNLRGTSDATLQARDAMRSQVQIGVSVLENMAAQGASSAELASKANELAGKLEITGVKAGLSGKAVRRYADDLRGVPGKIDTTIAVRGDAETALSRIVRQLKAIDGTVVSTTIVTRSVQNGSVIVRSGRAQADGGRIPLGLGGPREDNVPAWLSSGEFVVNAASTEKYLPLLEAINAKKFADGGRVGYAAGGQVVDLGSVLSRGGFGNAPPTKDDLLKATTAQRQALDALRVAEMKLEDVRKRKKRTATQIAAAEAALAKARDRASAATRTLRGVEAARARSGSPTARLSGAVVGEARNLRAFLTNLDTLRRRGYGRLADQLLDLGDEQAQKIAADAARRPDAALRQVDRQLRSLAAAQNRLDVAKNGKPLTELQQFSRGQGPQLKDPAAFVRNVKAIAARGFGRLAAQLAEAGDEAAERAAAEAVKASDATLQATSRGLRQQGAVQDQLAHLKDSTTILAAVKAGHGTGLAKLSGATGLGYADLLSALAYVKDTLAKDPAAKGLLADLAKYAATGSFATGGLVTGPGTSTSDSVLARLSAGEYVVKADAVRRYGLYAMSGLNNGRWASPGQAIAAGGASSAPAGGEDHLHFHLDSAAATRAARGFAAQAIVEKAKSDSLRARRRP